MRDFIVMSNAAFATADDYEQSISARLVKAQSTARESENNRSVCLYRTNVMAFLTGIATLARAPKIMDNTKIFALAAPIGFSRCEKAPNAALSPIAPVTPISLMTNARDGAQFTVLEEGYSGAFSASPSDPSLLTVAPAFDKKNNVIRDAFVVMPATGAHNATTFVTVSDAYGQTREVFVRLVAP